MGVVTRDASSEAQRALQRRASAFYRRFPEPLREPIRRFAAGTRARADLVTVFPGAAVALVTRFGGSEACQRAIALLDEERPLKEVAAALGVPMWLRRLQPEAFATPLSRLPDDEEFSRRITPHLPRSRLNSAAWLRAVIYAYHAVGRDFAIWIAHQPIHDSTDSEPRIAMLSAWAWFSGQIGTDARQLMSARWGPDLSFETALIGTKTWFNRVRLATLYLNRPVADSWLEGGMVRGFAVVPLLTAKDLLAESRAMFNCVDQFAKRIADDRCRLFSIRSPDGVRIATVEIGQHPREVGFLAINQIKGRHNLPASAEAWQIAYSWMGGQRSLSRMPPTSLSSPLIDRSAWASLMKPYWDAMGEQRAVPRALTLPIIDRLDEDLTILARRSGVTCWLFN